MKKYIFKIYQKDSNGNVDDQNVWEAAESLEEAKRELYHSYWGITDIVLLKVEDL